MDINTTAAMSMAEGHPRYAMDVSMVFGGKTERDRVLRTTFDQLGVWKTKYADVGISKYEPEKYVTFKEAATIINPATKKEEIWVFGIDSTKADDIVTAVEIATDKYKTLLRQRISKGCRQQVLAVLKLWTKLIAGAGF